MFFVVDRFAVIAFVLEQYNSNITYMGDASLGAACKMAARLVKNNKK